jgi:NAD+ kinase
MRDVIFTAFRARVDAAEIAAVAQSVLMAEGIPSRFHFLEDEPPALTDDSLVVSLGGDGTFLRAARLAHGAGAAVLAVNLGRVGFLLDVPADGVAASVREAIHGATEVEHLALAAHMPDGSVVFALNELVVERQAPGHMVQLTTYLDDEFFLSYSADGVMVATPTGSTAYNFSAGGPIVDADLPVLVLTPVAPHFTINSSVVVNGDRTVRLEVGRNAALVVADSHVVATLNAGESVSVRRSERPVRVVRAGSFSLGRRLRENLREGHA